MVGAVDVDVTVVSIDVATEVDAWFEAAQPEDAAGDEIGRLLGVGEFGEVPAGGDAAFENHAGGLSCADAFGDFVQAARCAEGVFDVGWRA